MSTTLGCGAPQRCPGRLLLPLACLLSFWTHLAEPAEPAAEPPKQPSVRVTVDPRVELLSVIFRLAGNSEYSQGRVASYTNDVEKQFGEFRDHPAVELAAKLRRTRGVSYDACMSMAVHLTDAYTLEEKVPFEPWPNDLDGRWPPEGARQFLELARRFVKDSSFKEFIEAHQPLYRTTESRMEAVLKEHAHLEWFGEFFGERPQADFTVALGLLNGGCCYGPRCRTVDGREQLYCILGVWKTDAEGLPQFDGDMLGTVVHEFCHSYTNAIVDRYAAELKSAGEKILPHVESAMRRQGYGNWKTMMYESMVRASVVRYTYKHAGPAAARRAIENEKKRQFLWIGELSGLLAEYETHRDQYATLDAFFPKVVTFFDRYADELAARRETSPEGFFARIAGAMKQRAEDLLKEQALAARRPKVVSMTPPNGAGDVDPALAAIQVVFDRPMQDGSWSMCGSGPHFPELSGEPAYHSTRTIWTVPVKLKPDWSYQLMLNSEHFDNFRSQQGVPLLPVNVTFTTGKGGEGRQTEEGEKQGRHGGVSAQTSAAKPDR